MVLELNPQQRDAVKGATKWYTKGVKQLYEITGPAGSGKTTIIQALVDKVGLRKEEVIFVAFIGKAAQNLALKGHNAKTIHSTIYVMDEIPKYDERGNPILKNGRAVTYKSFKKKDFLPANIKLIVLDEAGTVDDKLARDLLSFNIPVIALGDLNQLPPVFGNTPFLKNPDVVLTQIMRQAEDSEIIWMSQQILQGKRIPYGRYNNSLVIPKEDVTDEMFKSVSMILASRNQLRDEINDYCRHKILGVDPKMPITVGDKVVCRRNNWQKLINIGDNQIYLINGMVGYIEEVHLDTYKKNTVEVDFRPDFLDHDLFRFLKLDLDYFATPCAKQFEGYSYFEQFQLAYAISVHLSQGSQYDSILYYKDGYGFSDYQKRLDYTALTRAENSLILVQ